MAQLCFALSLIIVMSAAAPLVRATGSASIWTDKQDYHPEEVVTITGADFSADTIVTVSVTRPDGQVDSWDVTSNGTGGFVTTYQLDGITGNYTAYATDGINSATTTFTDSPPKIDLDQCRNGPADSPNDCENLGGGTGWVNGNAGDQQSHYVEGYSIPYRAVMTDIPTATSITVVLGYDITHSSRHAIDYLTQYQRLEPHLAYGHPAETVYPTDGVSGISGTTTTFPIPAPSSTSPCASPVSGQPTASFNSLPSGERVMTLFGGTITAMSYVSEGCLTDAQAETQISITFTAASSSAVLSWGGHIARALDWGAGNSAGGISGSPYHMRLKSWTLGSVGNQDRSLSAGAVLPTGTVVINKITIGGDATFGYTSSGSGIDASFTITTVGGSGSKTYSDIPAGSKTVTESSSLPAGWSFTSLTCSDPDFGTTTSGAVATIDLDAGETVTCTFTNTNAATLTVIKHVINDNGGTLGASSFTVHVKSGGVDVAGSPAAGSETGTAYTLTSGTYAVSEDDPPAGYVQVGFSGDCDSTGSVTLTAGDSKTCTITNDDVAPSLTLIKVVNNNHGGTAVATDWTLSAAGPTPISGTTPVTSGAGFSAGTYTLSESGPSGYSASAWSCVGGSQSGSAITLTVGQTATCTITNDDIAAHLTLVKHVTNDNGGTAVATDFTLTASGPTPISGAGGVESDVNAGTYTLSESGPSGYDASAWSCVGGSQSGSSITLALAESATCTITNDDIAPSLTLIKVVINDNGGTAVATAWTLSAAGPTPLSGTTPVTSGAGFSAGTYSLSESGPSGYDASAWSCVGGSQSGSSITLDVGETATCTITNDDIAPSLTLIKHVTNDNGGTEVPTAWMLTASGPTPISGPGGATSGASFAAGTYILSESGPSGYDASAWSCVGGSQSGSSITLALAESATCTITNDDIAPSLTLVKEVVNDNGGQRTAIEWMLAAAGPTPISGPGGATSGAGFAAGTYTLSEAGPTDYAASAWSCVGGSQSGDQIALALAESATCTITNDDIAPSLTLVKQVINDNGGSAVATDWLLSAAGPTPISGPGGVSSGAGFSAGTYALSESGGPSGYSASAWSCVGGSQSGSAITLALAQTATCTITNDDIAPSLTLIKEVINDNGGTALTTDFTLSASGPTPISGEGGVSSGPTFSAGTYDLSETGPSGYSPSSWTCTGGTQSGDQITLALDEDATCTITNDDIAPELTLVKVVVSDNGGTRTEVEWTLFADGPTPISGEGGATSGADFSAGTYLLSETGPSDYAAGAWSCVGGFQALDAITLAVGESATCTITNDDIAPSLTLVKNVDNGGTGGSTPADFTLVATGPTPLSGPGPLVASGPGFSVGTYALSESGPSGYDASAWTCAGGTQNDDSITLALAESATCQITNTKQGTIIVQKFSYGGTGTFDYSLEGSEPIPGQITTSGLPGFGTFAYENLVPTGVLGHGTYTLTETGLPPGWTLMSITCTLSDGSPADVTVDILARQVVINLPIGETVICTFENVLKSIVSDSALCTFDRDADAAGQQFRLIFTPDPQGPAFFKATATNPGQFYYNIFVMGTGTVELDVSIPYPFVTQGATPIHAYDSATINTVGDQQCIVPGTEIFHSQQIVTLADYGNGDFGTFVQLTITFPRTGFAYVNVHLDYGLKGTSGWQKVPTTNNARNGLVGGPLEGLTIVDRGDYAFSYAMTGDGGDTQTVQNENVFKKDPGFAGRVLYTIDNPAPGITVSVTRVDSGSYIGSGTTDIDGYFIVGYKHTGKAAYFRVCVVGYPDVPCQVVLMKANSFVYLETPFFLP